MNRRPVPFRTSPAPTAGAPGIPLQLALLAATALLVACSGEDAADEDPSVAAAPLEITGRYEMSGVTVTPGSDQKRKINGSIILEQKGEEYVASFEFKTNFPGEGPPVDADVIGVGEGRIAGRQLKGTAHTQIVVSSVPGVDTGFAFIPRLVSARIVSDSVGEFQPDGTLHIEIESRADEGEIDYQATRTRMRGKRVGDIGSEPFKPDPRGKRAEEGAAD